MAAVHALSPPPSVQVWTGWQRPTFSMCCYFAGFVIKTR
ncbi:hypothetical protein C882_3375 [Caenispirillum salinarum AK4]|uniref:Uncharacterized protein n=1 Tax=Caenispirillum salinarum AK4 TaxID=1238182 RepID=K9GJ01_9PROT|nr:hypothetical protein C882_3375 [Caenispirillum salinarum AK4]